MTDATIFPIELCNSEIASSSVGCSGAPILLLPTAAPIIGTPLLFVCFSSPSHGTGTSYLLPPSSRQIISANLYGSSTPFGSNPRDSIRLCISSTLVKADWFALSQISFVIRPSSLSSEVRATAPCSLRMAAASFDQEPEAGSVSFQSRGSVTDMLSNVVVICGSMAVASRRSSVCARLPLSAEDDECCIVKAEQLLWRPEINNDDRNNNADPPQLQCIMVNCILRIQRTH
mmetsp:Transcript_1793/g.3851  ORF Transcript_1793/g.3851 Transcript_1793/m.3851 type:complete len:231 (+) Transcript_1793:950-1642(+)